MPSKPGSATDTPAVRPSVAGSRPCARHASETRAHLGLELPWRDFLRAWGELRASNALKRDEEGNYGL